MRRYTVRQWTALIGGYTLVLSGLFLIQDVTLGFWARVVYVAYRAGSPASSRVFRCQRGHNVSLCARDAAAGSPDSDR